MASIPNDCIAELPGLGKMAWLAIMPDGSRQYVPVVDGAFDMPKAADDTHLITFNNGTPKAHPSSKLYYDNGEYNRRDYVPELP